MSRRFIEIEITFEVDDTTPLPDWAGAEVRVGPAELRELDARYLDTPDLQLARDGFALRKRTGGPDEGWHLKGPRVGNGRVEYGLPLTATTGIPDDVLTAVITHTKLPVGARLCPLARIRNSRTAFAITEGNGTPIAEFVDDRVRAVDERSGTKRCWREWEVELHPDVPAAQAEVILARLTPAIERTGARPARSASKLARALGH